LLDSGQERSCADAGRFDGRGSTAGWEKIGLTPSPNLHRTAKPKTATPA
jgi:hypothetical protein